MSAATGLYISGCKDHPGMTDLSCLRIRRADGTPLDLRQVWAVIQEMEQVQSDLLEACKSAESALVDLGACNDADCHDCPGVLPFVRREIAKAEGRANG